MTNEAAIKDLQMHNCESCSGLFCKNGCAINMAISTLKSQRWIPVTERIPEELDQTDSRWSRYSRPSEDVLAVVSGRCNVLWFSHSDKLWFSIEEDITYWEDEVTHWMPLPQPPKEES